jgi:hypothetical protein
MKPIARFTLQMFISISITEKMMRSHKQPPEVADAAPSPEKILQRISPMVPAREWAELRLLDGNALQSTPSWSTGSDSGWP